jgi:aminoglycoside 3-N-acetyltransferase
MIPRSAFIDFLHSLTITPNDVLLVHSALRRIGPIEGGADGIIDAFLHVLSPSGLLAVPTHTWSTVNDQQPVFHETYTPSHVGTLTNVLRARPTAVRSLHPTHSVAAIGSRAREFTASHERDTTPCSPTSPYGKMVTWRGKIILLGVDLTRCTFFHCLEELAGLGDLWSIDPIARPRVLIRADGTVLHVKVRGHINGKSDNYHRVESQLADAGILTRRCFNDAPVLAVDAAAAADYLVPRLRQDPHLFW